MVKNGNSSAGYQFSTFKGVFTPSILTILGVVMYLRFGWVLGNTGLAQTITIVTISSAITFLTGLSIAALATNMKVGGGGTYFIISRSLGLEAGAAIGIPLFFAQALSISFYVIGFTESVSTFFPILTTLEIALITLFVLTILAFFSAGLAMRIQTLILLLIGASLLSFFSGTPVKEVLPTEESLNLPQIKSFWLVFAVFFPAVTGIEAGIAMSGDLKDPARSIPKGTIAAVLVSYVIYIAIPIFLSKMVADHRWLLMDPLIMKRVARWGDLVLVGLWGATLSSALGSLLAAPRTLQALAKDGIVSRIFGRGFGKGNDPRYATAASFLIGFLGIIAGELNFIATILTMFFLTAYGLLNLAAAFEALIAPPSWRPKFQVHWYFPLLGAIGCLCVMFLINQAATLIATVISIGIYFIVQQKRLTAYWGDIRRGVIMLGARLTLYWLNDHVPNIHSWKPNILVLSGSPTNRWHLIALADAISQGKGFLTIASILSVESAEGDRIENVSKSIHQYLKDRQVPAFVKVHIEKDVFEGAESLVKSYGFGPMVPNTVLLGDTEKKEHILPYAKLMLLINQLDRNLVIVREGSNGKKSSEPSERARIDVWWRHETKNLGLMMSLAHLLKTSPEWAKSKLIIKTIVESAEENFPEVDRLKRFARENRLDAEVKTFTLDGKDPFTIINEASAEADIVFMGLRNPQKDESPESFANYYMQLMTKSKKLPPTVFILAAEELEFDRIFELSVV